MTSRNNDFVQSTLEVLTSSNSYSNRGIPTSYNSTNFEYRTENNQPPFQFEQQCEPSPIIYNDNNQEQNEVNYYKTMTHSLNDEIGERNNKLYTIDSQRNNNDCDKCQCYQNSNRQYYDEDNYSMIRQKDIRLIQLEQNRRRLIEKNKELELQLQELEKFSSQCKTNTIDNSLYNTFRTGTSRNGKVKPKISNTAHLRKTKSMITSNPFNSVSKPSITKDNKIEAIQSKMESLRKMIINNTEKTNIVKTIKNTETFIVDYVKYLNKTHSIQTEKSNKQIDRLTRENRLLKEKLSQMKSLIK